MFGNQENQKENPQVLHKETQKTPNEHFSHTQNPVNPIAIVKG